MNLLSHIKNAPRLFTCQRIESGAPLSAEEQQTHYLRNVLRMQAGQEIRLFNGLDGEWICEIHELSKKVCLLFPKEQIRPQPEKRREIHLLFAPIKKHRMDFLIEKSVELGVTHLHPVVTRYTEVRKINRDKIHLQMIEACEQCERMDIPDIEEISDLGETIAKWNKTEKIFACIERLSEPATIPSPGNIALLIGPEGGFSDEEKGFIQSSSKCVPLSLGSNVLRAETAALAALSLSSLSETGLS